MGAKTVNELTLKLNASIAELRKDLAKARGQLNTFQKGVKSIGASIKGAFAVDAIVALGRKLIQFGKEALQMGAQLAGIKREFDKLNQPDLLNQLREATAGTISDLKLMQQTVKAKEFGIPIEQMGTMMQFATLQAQKMGESVDYMAESITTGLARGSVQILDNLGLSAKDLRAEMKKTGDISKAAITLMNERIKESGGIIETAATVTSRWGARWDNMKAGIGAMINDVLVKISPILEDIRNWFIDLWKSTTKFIIDTYNGWVDLYNSSMAFRMIVQSISFAFSSVWETVKSFFDGLWNSLKTAGKSLAYVFNPSNWGKGFAKGLNKILLGNVQNTIKLTKELGNEIGKNFRESVDKSISGKAKYLTIDELMFKGGTPAAIGQAKKTGADVKGALIKAMSAPAGDKSMDRLFEELPSLELMDKWGEDMATSISETMAATKGVIFDSTDEVTGLLRNSIGFFAEGIGDLLTGAGEGIAGLLKGFMNIILDFGMNLGKQLIALGTAAIGLKTLFKNPWTAIAAGIALIAVSKAIKNIISKGAPKFAGGGIIPGTSFSGDRVPILGNSGEMILNSGQQANLFKQINNGGMSGGGVLTARISGNDLLFILDKAQKHKNNFY